MLCASGLCALMLSMPAPGKLAQLAPCPALQYPHSYRPPRTPAQLASLTRARTASTARDQLGMRPNAPDSLGSRQASRCQPSERAGGRAGTFSRRGWCGSHLRYTTSPPSCIFQSTTPLCTKVLGSHPGIWHGARAAIGRKLKGPLVVLHQ